MPETCGATIEHKTFGTLRCHNPRVKGVQCLNLGGSLVEHWSWIERPDAEGIGGLGVSWAEWPGR